MYHAPQSAHMNSSSTTVGLVAAYYSESTWQDMSSKFGVVEEQKQTWKEIQSACSAPFPCLTPPPPHLLSTEPLLAAVNPTAEQQLSQGGVSSIPAAAWSGWADAAEQHCRPQQHGCHIGTNFPPNLAPRSALRCS